MTSKSAHTGITALDIINPNAAITHWLNVLAEGGVITREILSEASAHFGLKRDRPAWMLFFKRIFILLGVTLGVCGLIFFMAWNWEDMSRIAKFITLEAVFVLFGAYSVLRRRAADGGPRWDARMALFGAALLAGGMLALYGQLYQTGADPWELFRAWTFMLVILAVPGRATVFWFMVWLVGSLWCGLYLAANIDPRWDTQVLALLVGGCQFVMLAFNEIASHILNKRNISYDRGRWLSRTIGSAAIACLAFFAVGSLADSYWTESQLMPTCFYGLSLALTFAVYYKFIPELLFLSLSVFSLATFTGVKVSVMILGSRHFDLGMLLFLGLFFLALVFASLKLILMLNKGIRARARESRARRPEPRAVAHSLSFFKSREEKKAELKEWLIGRGAALALDIESCYAADEKDQNLESPWYVKVFLSIGVWIGSGVSLAAFTALVFTGLDSLAPLGVLGVILCGLSIQIGHGKKPALRAFGQVLGVCGLIYAAAPLFDFGETPVFLLLSALFALFWLFKPPFAARLGAFLGSLLCLCGFLGGGSYFTLLYIAGLLWGVHYLVVMDGRPPAKWKNPGGEWLAARFNLADVLSASAYACLIYFAALAISLPEMPRELLMPGPNMRLGTAAVFIALTGLMALRYPEARVPSLAFGPLLAILAWFAPYLALGFGLVLLAFHTGLSAFLGTAVAYLGCSTWLYYYSLELSLLYKSLVLMGTGLAFLALGFGLSRLTGERAA